MYYYLLLAQSANRVAQLSEDVNQELNKDKQRFIVIPFTYGKKGNVWVYVRAEVPLTESGKATAFSGFRVLEAVRQDPPSGWGYRYIPTPQSAVNFHIVRQYD